MAAAFQFEHRIEFLPGDSDELLRSVPAAPGVFALRGAAENSEPYLTRAADLRRRLRRLLAPPEALNADGTPVLSKRLNLRERVRWIEWTRTGSEFESSLLLYRATRAAFGAEAARNRLRLYAPFLVRITLQHQHPRAYVTNRLSRRSIAESFGPFPSRAAAERYCDAVLDLFKLRRCYEDLEVHPGHPGCAYGEMKKCIEPCRAACTGDAYAAEAQRVHAFFATRGGSMLTDIAARREAASEAMDFEQAAALHKQWEKVKAAATLADEIVGPIADLRALIVQEAAPHQPSPHDTGDATPPLIRLEEAAVFLLDHGHICGPQRLSTLGVRAVREQTAVGSSLFAQPLMLAAVPLDESIAPAETEAESSLSPEERARAVLHHLHEEASKHATPLDETCDYLALFRRWYFRPEKQRAGEVFLPNPDSSWPIRRILNGAARVVLGPPAAAPPVDREAFKGLKTKLIHEGREGVERTVAVLPKRSRPRKMLPNVDSTEVPSG